MPRIARIEQCPLPRYPWIVRAPNGRAVMERDHRGIFRPMYCTTFDSALSKAEWVERSTPRNSRIRYPED